MSNQEQQLHSSENYPPGRYPQQPPISYYEVPTSVNVDPREQQQQMMYGVPEYYGGQGEKLQPRPPQHRRRSVWLLWLLSPILLLILVMGIAGIGFGVSHPYGKHFEDVSLSNYVYNIATTPKLIINDNIGTVRVHSAGESSKEANTVTIQINKSDNSEPDPIVNFDKGSGVITIKAVEQGFSNHGVDIDITTPATSNVQLNDGSGDVNIEGITGTIDAQTTDGDVSVEGGSLSGPSFLNSVNGSIHYSGSLAAQGNYEFGTTNGDIDVTLPDTSALHIDANATHGRLDNEFGGNDIGSSSPRASLTLQSENGSIDIHKNG